MARKEPPGKTIEQIMDEVTQTELTSSSLARIGNIIKGNNYPDLIDIETLLDDLKALRYRFTVNHMTQQITNLVNREKNTTLESIGDLRHAGKTLVWVLNRLKEHRAFEEEEGKDDA
jgi:hypothetical protein